MDHSSSSRIPIMSTENRSVPVDTVLPHVVYQNLPEAIAWLNRAFGFEEYYRYGDPPAGGQLRAAKAVIQVRQARDAQKSPAQLGFGTQSLTIFLDDVDAHYARAKAAGAKILEHPHETEYGEISIRRRRSRWPPLALLPPRPRPQPRRMGCHRKIGLADTESDVGGRPRRARLLAEQMYAAEHVK